MSYILLVEDNQENADMTIRILESVGYQVKHVLQGLQAAKVAQAERPALILMDFDLPDVSGRMMTILLKRQLGEIPVIAVTARAGQAEEAIARNFGCNAFISKPFLPKDFLQVVNHYLPLPEKQD